MSNVLNLFGLVDVALHCVAGTHRRHLPRIAFLDAALEGLHSRDYVKLKESRRSLKELHNLSEVL